MKAIHVIDEHHVERRRGGAFFLIAADVEILVIGPAVRQPVDQPWIAMIGEDNGFIGGEEGIEVFIRQAVRMFIPILQASSDPRH